ncbi:alcohol dehydrogenase catalytic domain-containing protein [uncultured Anaerotruncus sp.]|uniref:alcohol dehydrogenase catalytic domain-containing protein n=1 Tax=uncultured Anaerotruncus sp. TaxID=905011 RepID=UPI00280BF62A|nr:alcohol dehydrogenase catalytic domain-containing protein [uncultured Anaerotruncus sp.]
MKGLIKEAPGSGARYRQDLPVPEAGAGEVLVKVGAAAICGTDMHILDWTPYAQERVRPPMVFGHEFAGTIVKTGEGVRRFSVGDRVAGETHIPCNDCVQCRTGNAHICEHMKIIGVHVPGCFAEYIAVPEDCLWRLDDSINDQAGALLEPMGVAVHGLCSGEVAGLDVLILGCGPIGLFAVAAARALGARRVFALDLAPEKLDLAAWLGADRIIDGGKESFTDVVLSLTGGAGADVIVDYTGSASVVSEAFRALKKGGRFTLVGLMNRPLSVDANDAIIYKEARVNGVTGRLMYRTWYDGVSLISSGRVDPLQIVGGIYPLSRYEEAFSALKAGKAGKMLLIP